MKPEDEQAFVEEGKKIGEQSQSQEKDVGLAGSLFPGQI